jgi:hypothetical protein
MQPEVLAIKSFNSRLLPGIRPWPHSIAILNASEKKKEALAALKRRNRKEYCFVNPTVINKTRMQNTNRWANLSKLNRSQIERSGMSCPGVRVRKRIMTAHAIVKIL